MSEFKRIDAALAQSLREQGAAVVDIRDPQSFARVHISGSQHLNNQSLPDFIRAADLDQPLLVVCYHGNSSQSAAAYLVGQGFADVYSLDGGIEAWQASFPGEVSSLPEEKI
jgi:thiosulfate sulfurtransferase